MKNLLITFVTIAVGFGITYYVLDSVLNPNKSINNGIVNSNTSLTNSDNEGSESKTAGENTDDNTSETNNDQQSNEMFPEDLDQHLVSLESWNDYYEKNIDLSSEFIALNADGEEIEKGDFLSDLTSGEYAPIKLMAGEEMYQLYNLDETQGQIADSIKKTAEIVSVYHEKEGTKLPEFNFVDLNGTKFSSENTKEKIIIMKCWHINDKPGIAEFKELNDLYDEYEAYEDVLFLSLAYDQPSALKQFLTKNEFRYPVIANQRDYIENEIGVTHFPTHLIIDEEGYIEKMAHSVKELKEALNRMSAPDISDIQS